MPTITKVQVSPYVNFSGRAREAMEFYKKVLGGKLDLHTAGDRAAYARLELDGASIVGVDGHPNYPAKVGENMAIALSGTDPKIFDELAAGGKIKGALTAQSSGAGVGYLEDQFGISWVVTIEKA